MELDKTRRGLRAALAQPSRPSVITVDQDALRLLLDRLDTIDRRAAQVRGGYGPHRRPPEVVDFLLAQPAGSAEAPNPTTAEPEPVHPTAVTFAPSASPVEDPTRRGTTVRAANWPRPLPMSAAWDVFEACETCSAPAGRSCVDLRTGDPVLNAHPGRRQRGPRARR